MTIQLFKITLFLFTLFSSTVGGKSSAQEIPDSITKRLKLECKQFAQESKYDSAYYIAQKLKVHTTKIGDTVSLLNSYYRLGFYAYKNGNPVQALKEYNSGIDLKVPLKIEEHKLPLLFQKSGILTKVGDYKEAQKIALQGIDLAKENNRIDYLRDFYNDFAISAANNQDFTAAEEAYQNVLKYSTNDKEKASVLNNIGVYYKHQKKYAQAIKVYDSILIYLNIKSPRLEAKIKSNLGFALSESGNKERALPLLKSALITRINEGDNSEIFASYIHLTSYYKDVNRKEAIRFARKAYQIAQDKTKSPDSQKEALQHIVELNSASNLEARKYIFLEDSIKQDKQKRINEYTASKFQIREREIEIASQKEEIAVARERIAKKETQNSYYLLGIIIITVSLIWFYVYVYQRKKILQRNHKIATMEARENERNNVSGKVHDYVVDKIREAMLFADHYNVQYPNLGFSNIAVKIDNAYRELRKVSQDYMPLHFDKINFPKRVQGLLEEREELYSITMDVEGLGEINWDKVSTTSKTELYRSLQELLINCSKYSQATHVSISFFVDKKQVHMEVEDNGIGCNISENIDGVGLADLKRRIADLNGTIYIFSDLNKGFLVKIGVPLN